MNDRKDSIILIASGHEIPHAPTGLPPQAVPASGAVTARGHRTDNPILLQAGIPFPQNCPRACAGAMPGAVPRSKHFTNSRGLRLSVQIKDLRRTLSLPDPGDQARGFRKKAAFDFSPAADFRYSPYAAHAKSDSLSVSEHTNRLTGTARRDPHIFRVPPKMNTLSEWFLPDLSI